MALPRTTSRPGAAPPAAEPRRASRRALAIALALAVAGIAISASLVRLHARAHAGYTSFCTINETVNCDRVATSRYAVLLGVPVAAWGVLGYATAAALAGWALTRRAAGRARGALFVVAAVAAGASVVLALVSEFLIGAWCLLCMGSWAIAGALLIAAWRACPEGVGPAIAADVAAARAHAGRTAAVALVGLGVIAALVAWYPRYAPPRASPPAAGAPPASAGGAKVLVEFSDYECPFCARAHAQLSGLRATRPDLQIVRRHFPLDAACNPALKRSIHPGACELARAAICADAQGRFAEMDDALFANQVDKQPVARLAARIGLDVPRFEACLGSPETARRLSADIADALKLDVRATPSYVLDGRVYPGELPPAVLAPAAGAPAPR
jgi:protein-disulfide isomerase